jgi:hypothetical protein
LKIFLGFKIEVAGENIQLLTSGSAAIFNLFAAADDK